MTVQKSPDKGAAIGLPSPPNLDAYLASTQEMQRILAGGVNPDGSLKSDAIRALLRFKGIEIKTLAELYGTSDQYFHQVINRERRDVRVEDLIATRLGLQSDRVWARPRQGAA